MAEIRAKSETRAYVRKTRPYRRPVHVSEVVAEIMAEIGGAS